MLVNVHWSQIRGRSDEKWQLSRVLYAYVDRICSELVYIGKADGDHSTVRSRWSAADKDPRGA
jgi:hypothetical protein